MKKSMFFLSLVLVFASCTEKRVPVLNNEDEIINVLNFGTAVSGENIDDLVNAYLDASEESDLIKSLLYYNLNVNADKAKHKGSITESAKNLKLSDRFDKLEL